MHEASLMQDLLRKILNVARAQKASRVVAVHVRLGALCHMDANHFRYHFEHAAAGTAAQGAAIHARLDSDIQAPTAAEVFLESVEVA